MQFIESFDEKIDSDSLAGDRYQGYFPIDQMILAVGFDKLKEQCSLLNAFKEAVVWMKMARNTSIQAKPKPNQSME
jgi:hypothetical protein